MNRNKLTCMVIKDMSPKMSEKTQQRFEDLTNRLYDAMQQGPSEVLKAYIKVLRRFYDYSPGNRLLIALQKPDATYVMGYKKWTQFGRHVKKGEKAIWIWAPIRKKVKILPDLSSGGSTPDDHKGGKAGVSNAKEDFHYVVVGYTFVAVFDLSQTEGEPFEIPDPLDQVEIVQPISFEGVLERVERAGIPVEIAGPAKPGSGGWTNGKKIVLYKRKEASMLSVLLHELVHYRLHFIREKYRSEVSLKQAELEAEFGSYLAGGLLGVESLQATSDYLISYRVKPEELYHALTRAGEAALWVADLVRR